MTDKQLEVATLGSLTSLLAYLFPAVRNVERDLPDFDAGG